MFGKNFEKKVNELLTLSKHPSDQKIYSLRANHTSYYGLLDEIFDQHNLDYGVNDTYMFVGEKRLNKSKSIKSVEEWMAKEMLYKVRGLLST